jgi:putative ABC transport system permease protein
MRLGKIMKLFTAIALLLACVGLFGLSFYAAQQRTKEIGIRKILGASAASILVVLARDFVRLTAISLFIALPVAWWAMKKWLQDFAYRTAMGWGGIYPCRFFYDLAGICNRQYRVTSGCI